MVQSPDIADGYVYLGFAELGSTSDYARDIAKSWFEEGNDPVWIHAEMQTAGRGRRGREWLSRKGNLSATLLLKPTCEPREAAELSFVAAIAISDVLSALSPIQPVELKWPNDVLLGGAKIAGILLESEASPQAEMEWLSIGCGVNLAFHPEDTPYKATSLAAASITPPEPGAFLGALSAAFAKRYDTWTAEGFKPIRKLWLSRARGLGAPIEARIGEKVYPGIFEDLDETGALMLKQADGSRRLITAGEVFFV